MARVNSCYLKFTSGEIFRSEFRVGFALRIRLEYFIGIHDSAKNSYLSLNSNLSSSF